MDIKIRPLRRLDEMGAAVELQKIYWGEGEESVVPAHMLYSLASHGGHVLAAFDGDYMVGVLIGFLGTDSDDPDRPAMANLQLVSKRMVVHPEYRSAGLGYRLKLAQRDLAIRQGVRLVTWTFDPLLSPNAHLNVHKLGVVCPTYLIDYYGSAEGGLSEFGNSDRLLAEWWVTHRRVEERVSRTRGELKLASYLDANTPILNPTNLDNEGLPEPAPRIATPKGSLALLEIPSDYRLLRARDEALARHWRIHIRDAFLQVMGKGFLVTDFLYQEYEDRQRSFYLLSYNAGLDFRMN